MSMMKDVLEVRQALGIDDFTRKQQADYATQKLHEGGIDMASKSLEVAAARFKEDGTIETLGSKEGQALRFNAGKLEWTRLPFDGLEDVVAMLMKSAKKYPDAPDGTPNFRKLWGDETPKITLNCAMRHLIAIMNGEEKDSDSGHYHSSHVIANMMFLNLYYNQKQKETAK